MADAQDLADLSELVTRIGQDRLKNQATFVQRLVAISLPEEEDYETPPAENRLTRPIAVKKDQRGKRVVNVSVGGTGGLGAYDDGTARPAGSGRPVVQGEKLPALLAETLLFTLAEVDIADGHDAQTVNKVERTLKAHGSQFGAYIARSVWDPAVDEPTADVSLGATSMVVQDASGYIEGQRYEDRVIATGALKGEFVVALITPVFGGGATITFESPLGFAIDVSEEALYLKGQGDLDDPKHIGSLWDITDSTQDLYGLPRATVFPAGIYESVGGAFSNADGKEAHSSLSMRSNPTHWVGGPRAIDKVTNAQQDDVRFIAGSNDHRDPFADAMVPEYCGLPMVRCPQASDTRIVLGNFNNIEFREHVPYGPRRMLSAEKGEFGRGSLRESEDIFGFKILFDGFYSMVTECRRDFLTLDNVTS